MSWVGQERKDGTIFIQHTRFDEGTSSGQLVFQVTDWVKDKKLKRVCPDRPAKYVNLNIRKLADTGAYRFIAPLAKSLTTDDEGPAAVDPSTAWNTGEVKFVL